MNLFKDQVNHFIGPQPSEKYDKEINIVVAHNGVFHVRKTNIGTFVVQIGTMKVGYGIAGLPDMEEGFHFDLPKIPFRVWLQGLAYSKAVYKRDFSECSLVLFYDPANNEYFFYCPEQENNGSASEFEKDRPQIEELSKQFVCIGEFHSHNVMGAFSSSIDDKHENRSGIYGVYGTITTSPSFYLRFACAGIQKKMDIWDIFERPVLTMDYGDGTGVKDVAFDIGTTNIYPDVAFPEEWMAKTKKIVPVTTYCGGGHPNAYQGYDGGGYWYNGRWVYAESEAAPTQKKDTKELDTKMKDINQSITTGSQVNGAKDIDTKQSNVIPLPTDQKKTESFLMSLTPEDMAVLMLNFDDDFIRATISAMTLEGLLGPIVDGVERVANKINKSSAPKAPTASKITAAAQADQEDYDYEDPVTAHMKADECPPLPMGNKSKDDDAIKVAIGNKANSYQICRATPSSCKFYSSCMECPVQEDLNIGCCQCKSAENGSCTTYRLMK